VQNKQQQTKIFITDSPNYKDTIDDVLIPHKLTTWSKSKRDKLTRFDNSKVPSLIKTISQTKLAVSS